MKIIHRLFLAIFFSSSALMSGAHAYNRPKIVVASDHWCPYACNPSDKDPGYLVEMVKDIFDIYDIDVEYLLMPWHESLDQLKQDKIDAVLGISEIEGRDFILTNVPQAYGYVSAFTRDDTEWIYDDIDSLNGKKLSMILDYNVADAVKQFVASNYPKNPNLFMLETGKYAVFDAINSLLDKTTDVYIEDETVVNYYLKLHNIHNIRNAGRIIDNSYPMFIAFSHTSTKAEGYKKMLEDGGRSLNATGDIQSLKKKYNVSN